MQQKPPEPLITERAVIVQLHVAPPWCAANDVPSPVRSRTSAYPLRPSPEHVPEGSEMSVRAGLRAMLSIGV